MPELDEPIELCEYQVIWPRVFAEEQRRICQALNISSNDLEHIGSTAVPGLVAKPIVDLMLGISRLPPDLELLKRLELLGWEAMGEAGVLGRLYFRLRSQVQANLSVVLKRGEHCVNNLAIRGARTLLPYSAEKADFVRTLLKEALAIRRARGSPR